MVYSTTACVQFTIGATIMIPGHVLGLALRTMMAKQAAECKHTGKGELGKGELHAALNGISSLVQIVMPMVWGLISKASAEAQPRHFSPMGAQFLIAALLRLVSWQLVRSCAEISMP